MKSLDQVTARIVMLAQSRSTYSGKARHINQSFKGHNARFEKGEEQFKVEARYDPTFYNCEVVVKKKSGQVVEEMNF